MLFHEAIRDHLRKQYIPAIQAVNRFLAEIRNLCSASGSAAVVTSAKTRVCHAQLLNAQWNASPISHGRHAPRCDPPYVFAPGNCIACRVAFKDNDPMNQITINADIDAGTISRHIYGHFAEHLGRRIYGGIWVGEHSPIPNTRGIRNDVVRALRGVGIPNLRWPGGCFADEYHWMALARTTNAPR